MKIDTVLALMYYIEKVAELLINELSFVQIHIQTSGQLMYKKDFPVIKTRLYHRFTKWRKMCMYFHS